MKTITVLIWLAAFIPFVTSLAVIMARMFGYEGFHHDTAVGLALISGLALFPATLLVSDV